MVRRKRGHHLSPLPQDDCFASNTAKYRSAQNAFRLVVQPEAFAVHSAEPRKPKRSSRTRRDIIRHLSPADGVAFGHVLRAALVSRQLTRRTSISCKPLMRPSLSVLLRAFLRARDSLRAVCARARTDSTGTHRDGCVKRVSVKVRIRRSGLCAYDEKWVRGSHVRGLHTNVRCLASDLHASS